MRLLLVLLLILPGCADGLGLGADCSAEMTAVRLREGRSPDEVQGPEELGGNFVERWYYFVGGSPQRVYTFRWGVSFEACQVEGPSRFSPELATAPAVYPVFIRGEGGRP
jgi:hypothetical protein